MFKLVVLSVLIAVAVARPGHLATPLLYSAPAAIPYAVHETHSLAHVGNVVKSVPSSISHHSNSVVHSHAHVVQDVVAPVVKTTSYTTKSHATPIVETYADVPYVKSYAAAAPIVQTYAAAAAPAVHSYAVSPLSHNYLTAVAAPPQVHTYGGGAHYPGVSSTYADSAPLSYSSNGLW